MKIPLHLKRRGEATAADAFLLFGSNCSNLVSVHATVPDAKVFSVENGFLILPGEQTPSAFPGSLRLKRVSGDIFIPVDSVLVPSLLADEIAALTRHRGLVVLPPGKILSFDPRSPIPANAWLCVDRIGRADWMPFPDAPERAERLTLIERPSGIAAVIEILTSGEPEGTERLSGAGDAEGSTLPEKARPPQGSTLGRMAGAAGMAAGGLLSWLGRQFSMPGLARAGANLAQRALQSVPRLTEKLFGAQEAALRQVLRELLEGDVEKALRRAPPAVSDPDQPSTIGTTADLGRRDPRYSLRDLVSGGGGQAGWLGGGDVWQRLAEQYRRLAQEALARGDYRRAAYLYGMLLRDYRAAANALLSGGLYHDAAILFRDKVKDDRAAASAFEQAGEYDETLRLYEKHNLHEQAGDLLLRLEERDRARNYYLLAANVFAQRGRWLAAGDLLRAKLGEWPLCEHYYRLGWKSESGETITCAKRLFDEMIVAEKWTDAEALFAEAARRYGPPRAREASDFFNHVLSLGEMLPAPMTDEFADRTRLLFAEHLRGTKDRSNRTSSDFFVPSRHWPGPVLRDAVYAAPSSKRANAPLEAPYPFSIATGAVTAVVAARHMHGYMVIATTSAVSLWRPNASTEILCVPNGAAVLGLSIDVDARVVYVLMRIDDRISLNCFTEKPGFKYRKKSEIDLGASEEDDHWYLEPCVGKSGNEYRVTIAGPGGREMIFGYHHRHSVPIGYLRLGVRTHLLATPDNRVFWDWDDRVMRCISVQDGDVIGQWAMHWRPAPPPGSTLAIPCIDYHMPASHCLEVTGIDADGILHWSRFEATQPQTAHSTGTIPKIAFRAAGFIKAGTILAASADNELVSIRNDIVQKRERHSPFAAKVAAIVRGPSVNSACVVLEDGSVIQHPHVL